jgi:hypothetical protein
VRPVHANSAIGVAGITAVAENPTDFHIFLGAVTDQRELRATSFGVEAALDGQRIRILTPIGFGARYGPPAPDPRGGLVFGACDIAVADLAAAGAACGREAVRHRELLVVPPAPGQGTVIAFGGAHG